jgi:hypothetical protein
MRFLVATPSATTLLARHCGSAAELCAKNICTSPASTAFIAGATPLYGTWTMSMPAVRFRSSPARCGMLPLLADA